jgi:hypothetical protein
LNKKITLPGVGDNLLVIKDPEAMFALADPVLRSGDAGVGQLETPCTARPAITPLKGAAWV